MRNKLLLYYLLAIFSALCIFTACSDEDDEMSDTHAATSGEYWEEMAGVYRGKMNIEVDGVIIDTIYQQVEIASDNRNRMTLSTASLIVDEVGWSNMYFKNVYFSKNGDQVSFRAETVQYVGSIPNVSLVLTGTISGGYMEMSILANSVTIRPTTLSMRAEKLDEKMSSNTSILKMELNHELITRQPVVGSRLLVFYVSDTLDMDSTELLIRPEFTLAEGASISYPDSIMDFSEDVTYTVWAEDSIHRTEYIVQWRQAHIQKYEIGSWNIENGWDEPNHGWGTNNGNLKTLMELGSYTGEYAVKRVKGWYVGDWATEMTTVMTGEGEDKSIFAGSFFQGTFDLSMEEPLRGPVYGVTSIDSYRPQAVRGYYKYIPSNELYFADSLIIDTIRSLNDTCGIRAILYEVTHPDETLDSVNYMNDPKVVAIAELGKQAGQYQSEFAEFSINFDFIKSYSGQKRYKIAMICSSSRDSDKKRGAPRSVLTVGGFEVMFNHTEY